MFVDVDVVGDVGGYDFGSWVVFYRDWACFCGYC